MSITKKKHKLTKIGANAYCLELIFIFLNIFQPQKLMKMIILTEILFLRKKGKRLQKKKLGFKFIRINTSKEGYDADYEVSRKETFISKFKDGQLNKKAIKQKIKRTKR